MKKDQILSTISNSGHNANFSPQPFQNCNADSLSMQPSLILQNQFQSQTAVGYTGIDVLRSHRSNLANNATNKMMKKFSNLILEKENSVNDDT